MVSSSAGSSLFWAFDGATDTVTAATVRARSARWVLQRFIVDSFFFGNENHYYYHYQEKQPRSLIIFKPVEISQGVVASAACPHGAVRQPLKPPLSQKDRGMFSETQMHLRYQMSLDWTFRLCERLLRMTLT
jgi:hypothetical protein